MIKFAAKLLKYFDMSKKSEKIFAYIKKKQYFCTIF